MPELPEVECLRRALRKVVLHGQVEKMVFHRADLRIPIPKRKLRSVLVGRKIEAVARRSKYIVLQTDSGYAIVHLGMTGTLLCRPSPQPEHPHTHYVLSVTTGAGKDVFIHYVDPRRFGLITCESQSDPGLHPLLASLGPEPLSRVNLAKHLFQRSRGRRQAVKPFIMDARNVVGVGNIYACESLYLAGIDPRRSAESLSPQDFEKLAPSIRTILKRAIDAGGTTFRDFRNSDGKPGYFQRSLAVYGKGGHPCKTCQKLLSVTRLGGRSTFFCSLCQS